jgi:hypothetical protein
MIHEKKRKEREGKEKQRRENRSKVNNCQETKKEQKNKEKNQMSLHLLGIEHGSPVTGLHPLLPTVTPPISILQSPTSNQTAPTAPTAPTSYHINNSRLMHTHPHEQISRSLYTSCCSMKHRPEATQTIQV